MNILVEVDPQVEAEREEAINKPQLTNSKLDEINVELNLGKLVADNLTCSICSDLLYNPVTLLCQHTFCRTCLEEHQFRSLKNRNLAPYGREVPDELLADRDLNVEPNKCPTCNLRYFLPPGDMKNYQLQSLIENLVKEQAPDYFANREKDDKKNGPQYRNEIRRELRAELLRGVVDNLQLQEIYDDQDRDLPPRAIRARDGGPRFRYVGPPAPFPCCGYDEPPQGFLERVKNGLTSLYNLEPDALTKCIYVGVGAAIFLQIYDRMLLGAHNFRR